MNQKSEETNSDSQRYVDSQIKILNLMQNKNIIKFYEWFQNQQFIFIVTQYCNKGNLLQYRDKTYKNKRIPQKTALQFFQQILYGFEEICSKNILHRDLKLANILLHQKKQNQVILKISDFGLGRKLSSSKGKAKSCVGTPTIRAPQVYKGEQYGSQADIWSLGVLLYEMLFGRSPFNGINQQQINKSILETIPNYSDAHSLSISKEAVDFIKRCLVVDKEQRIILQEIFQHDFIKSNSIFVKAVEQFVLKIIKDTEQQQKQAYFTMNEIDILHMRDNRMFGIKHILPVKIQHLQIQKQKHFNVLYEIAKNCYIEMKDLRNQIESANLRYKYRYWLQFNQTKNFKLLCKQLLQDQMRAESLAVCFKEELKSINFLKYSKQNINRKTDSQKYKKIIKQYRSIISPLRIVQPELNKLKFDIMLKALEKLQINPSFNNQTFIRQIQSLKLSSFLNKNTLIQPLQQNKSGHMIQTV